MNDTRIPPHNKEAEQSIIGCMLLDNVSVSTATELLTPADFYLPSHKEIFDACVLLHQSGKPVDLVTLTDELDRRNTLDKVGGIEYLSELSRFVPSTSNVGHYIKIVEERSILRRLIGASGEISKDCFEHEGDIDQILGSAEKRIFDIAMRKNSDSLRHIHDALTESYVSISKALNSKGGITGVETGFSQLDHMTSGLHGSELIIIAGRPGMGKTSFSMNIVHHAATKQNVPVAFFSLEMSREQLATRLLCSESLVDMQKVRAGELSSDDFKELARAMQSLSLSPIYIDDTPALSVLEMRSKCRRLKIEKGLGLIVVDYLQLMQGSGKSDSRQQEISEMTRQLKNMARELDVPIIVLSQLSRASEKRPDHRPMLSDLRESGSIEQDADIVMFVYRERPSEDGDEASGSNMSDATHAEIILSKQRNGPTGVIPMTWLGQYTRFVALEPGEAPF